jgi:hypothetical protein
MAVVMEAENQVLLDGLSLDDVYGAAHARQSRIQKGNLKTVLERIESLQVDEAGRGLILAYNEATEEITVVGRQPSYSDACRWRSSSAYLIGTATARPEL